MRFTGMLAVIVVLACVCSSCRIHVSGHHETSVHAHGHHGVHVYRYYPGLDLYYHVGLARWYYLHGGAWRVSRSCPSHFHIAGIQPVRLELHVDHPRSVHVDIKRKHPGRGHAYGHDKDRRVPPGHHRNPAHDKNPAQRGPVHKRPDNRGPQQKAPGDRRGGSSSNARGKEGKESKGNAGQGGHGQDKSRGNGKGKGKGQN